MSKEQGTTKRKLTVEPKSQPPSLQVLDEPSRTSSAPNMKKKKLDSPRDNEHSHSNHRSTIKHKDRSVTVTPEMRQKTQSVLQDKKVSITVNGSNSNSPNNISLAQAFTYDLGTRATNIYSVSSSEVESDESSLNQGQIFPEYFPLPEVSNTPPPIRYGVFDYRLIMEKSRKDIHVPEQQKKVKFDSNSAIPTADSDKVISDEVGSDSLSDGIKRSSSAPGVDLRNVPSPLSDLSLSTPDPEDKKRSTCTTNNSNSNSQTNTSPHSKGPKTKIYKLKESTTSMNIPVGSKQSTESSPSKRKTKIERSRSSGTTKHKVSKSHDTALINMSNINTKSSEKIDKANNNDKVTTPTKPTSPASALSNTNLSHSNSSGYFGHSLSSGSNSSIGSVYSEEYVVDFGLNDVNSNQSSLNSSHNSTISLNIVTSSPSKSPRSHNSKKPDKKKLHSPRETDNNNNQQQQDNNSNNSSNTQEDVNATISSLPTDLYTVTSTGALDGVSHYKSSSDPDLLNKSNAYNSFPFLSPNEREQSLSLNTSAITPTHTSTNPNSSRDPLMALQQRYQATQSERIRSLSGGSYTTGPNVKKKPERKPTDRGNRLVLTPSQTSSTNASPLSSSAGSTPNTDSDTKKKGKIHLRARKNTENESKNPQQLIVVTQDGKAQPVTVTISPKSSMMKSSQSNIPRGNSDSPTFSHTKSRLPEVQVEVAARHAISISPNTLSSSSTVSPRSNIHGTLRIKTQTQHSTTRSRSHSESEISRSDDSFRIADKITSRVSGSTLRNIPSFPSTVTSKSNNTTPLQSPTKGEDHSNIPSRSENNSTSSNVPTTPSLVKSPSMTTSMRRITSGGKLNQDSSEDDGTEDDEDDDDDDDEEISSEKSNLSVSSRNSLGFDAKDQLREFLENDQDEDVKSPHPVGETDDDDDNIVQDEEEEDDSDGDDESFLCELNKGVVDWNESFQSLLAQEDSLEKFNGLAALARDFKYVAETYGRIIISESFCSDSERKIKPSRNVGGFAGGHKYVCQGILFKFALDVQHRDGKWLYGGDKPSHEKAMKAAANERKGLMSLFHCQIPNLHFPLMALIHYQGFCLIAMSILPVGRDTLIYGSADAGLTCCAKEKEMNEAMLEAGKKLNLRVHLVRETPIVGPGDIEGHRGTDGRYYLLDFSRVMPPEAPTTDSGREIFYNVLRPSFVRNYPKPLCSDAFSGWAEGDPNIDEINRDAANATLHLFSVAIPSFAKHLIEISTDNVVMKPSALIEELHRQGLNIRHLGKVRSKIHKKYVKLRQLILTECVARAIKNELRNTLRSTMENQKITRAEPSQKAVFQYLAPIFYQPKKVPNSFVEVEGIAVDTKNRTVKYEHSKTGSPWLLTVLSNEAISVNQESIFMEIKLIEGNNVWIGVCCDKVNDITSKSNYSYSCNDGILHVPAEGSGGTDYSRQDCHKDDVIGVFYNRRDKSILFTINKTLAGEYRTEKKHLILAIGITQQTEISYNFGTEPYVFDIEQKYCAGRGIPSPIIKHNKKAQKFWHSTVKDIVYSRYPGCLSRAERALSYNLKPDVDMPLLATRLQEVASIILSNNVAKSLSDPSSSFVLSRFDIESISTSVRDMGIVAFAEGVSLLLDVEQNNIEGQERQIKLLELAESKISSSVLAAGASYPQQYYYWGNVYYQLAKRHEGSERSHYLKIALEKYQHITSGITDDATENDPRSFIPKILYQEGLLLCDIGEFGAASHKFSKCCQLYRNIDLLTQRLKFLLSQSGVEGNLNFLVNQTESIITAFPQKNPIASLYVAEIAMKVYEQLFDEIGVLRHKAGKLATDHLNIVISLDKSLFEERFNHILSLAIDGNQFGVLLELCPGIKELKQLIEEQLIKGSLMLTHSRGLFAETINGYQAIFTPHAFAALKNLIEAVNKVDYVQIGGSKAAVKKQHIMQIVVVGDKASCQLDLTKKLAQQNFDQIRRAPSRLRFDSLENQEFFNAEIVIDNEACYLSITNNQNTPDELTISEFSGVSGVFILYSVKNKGSFHAAKKYYQKITQLIGKIPMVIIGNEVIPREENKPRVVSYEMGSETAKTLGIPFFESPPHGRSLNKALWELVRSILKEKSGKESQSESQLHKLVDDKQDEELAALWPQIQEVSKNLSTVKGLVFAVSIAFRLMVFMQDSAILTHGATESISEWEQGTNQIQHWCQQYLRTAHLSNQEEFEAQFKLQILEDFVNKPKRTANKVALIYRTAASVIEVQGIVREAYSKHMLCVRRVTGLLYSSVRALTKLRPDDNELKEVYSAEIKSSPATVLEDAPFLKVSDLTNILSQRFKFALLSNNIKLNMWIRSKFCCEFTMDETKETRMVNIGGQTYPTSVIAEKTVNEIMKDVSYDGYILVSNNTEIDPSLIECLQKLLNDGNPAVLVNVNRPSEFEKGIPVNLYLELFFSSTKRVTR
eukprot:TRINITY_DN1931_c0_g2_i1.p1 TRINITY_DN1931_c0_g2~~TRINITY_DN1931_c0_g2_i1.p1  ORF type:complete len:2425 (-),score=534.59 TRINITY_DN1931_c0_g2_i1:786-8060(-)